MSAVFGHTFRLIGAGAAMGGILSLCCGTASKHPTAIRPIYEHPTKGNQRSLDCFGLERESELPSMIVRLYELLHIDPSVRQGARRQYHVCCYRIQRFFVMLRRYQENPQFVRHKLELRAQGTQLLTSLSRMEEEVWDAREVHDIMRIIDYVQEFVRENLLATEK